MHDPLQGGRPGDSRNFSIGGIFKGIGKIVSKVGGIPGVSLIPGSGILRTAGSLLGQFTTGGGRVAVGNQQSRFRPGAGGALEDQFRAKAFGAESDRAAAAVAAAGNGCVPKARCPKINKSGYYVQTSPGNPAAGGTWVPPDSRVVARRSTNAGNARAARRAVTRLTSFNRLAKRVEKDLKRIARAPTRR